MAEGVDRPGQRSGTRCHLGQDHSLGAGLEEVGGNGHPLSWTPFSGFPSSSGPIPQTGFYGWDPMGLSPLSSAMQQQQQQQQQQDPMGLGSQIPFAQPHSPTSAFPPNRNRPSPSDISFQNPSPHFGHGVHGHFNSHNPLGASHHHMNSHFSSPSSPTERQPFSPVSASDGLDHHFGLSSNGWRYGQEVPSEIPSTQHNVSFYPEYPYPPAFGAEVSGCPVSTSPEPQDTLSDDFVQIPHSGISAHLMAERQKSAGCETSNSVPDGSPFSSMYTPFGTQEVHEDTPVPEEKVETIEPASAKLSYSEVAKAMKGKPSQRAKEESIYADGSSGATGGGLVRQKSSEGSHKGGKSTSRRGAGHGKSWGQNLEANLEMPVRPDSKYGLDSFESVDAQSSARAEEALSGSMESLSEMGRKGSVSSVGSSATSCGEETSGARSIPSSKKTPVQSASRDAGREQAGRQDSRTTTGGKGPQKSAKQDKPFFDPKRIFQAKVSNRPSAGAEDAGSQGHQAREEASSSSTQQVLNNGKPANPSKSAAAHKKPDYINNDLRDKRTNQTAAQNRGESGSSGGRRRSGRESSHHQQNGGAADRGRGGKEGRRDASSTRGRRQRREEEENARGVPLLDSIDWEAVDEWMTFLGDKMKSFAKSFTSFVITISFYLLGIFMYLVSGGVHLLGLAWMRVLEEVKKRIFKGGLEGNNGKSGRRRVGLEENIQLPGTGHEALQRLLSCRGKDPYSILGLKSDASEEDIKRYYRKQAVLVHPDKNQEPGAEEAFKILGHAFEVIGEPTKRLQYDSQLKVETEAEDAMREFTDLLTKLQEKMQEAANMMRCDKCGGKHKRVLVERPWYSARYCEKCNCKHQAKEGDIWAETSMLGFLWHYYSLMEGKVYDITEWAACKKDFFKQMQANAHGVYFRLATEGNRGRHSRANSGDPDIEDLLKNLFQKTGMQPDGTWPPPQPPGGASHPPGGSSMPNNKRTRRRKKKH